MPKAIPLLATVAMAAAAVFGGPFGGLIAIGIAATGPLGLPPAATHEGLDDAVRELVELDKRLEAQREAAGAPAH